MFLLTGLFIIVVIKDYLFNVNNSFVHIRLWFRTHFMIVDFVIFHFISIIFNLKKKQYWTTVLSEL